MKLIITTQAGRVHWDDDRNRNPATPFETKLLDAIEAAINTVVSENAKATGTGFQFGEGNTEFEALLNAELDTPHQ